MNGALFSSLLIVVLLTTEPVTNRNNGEYDTNPIESRSDGSQQVLERPLKRICDWCEYALKIHR